MSVYIHPRGPKYFQNYDKIKWDRDKQEPEQGEDNGKERSGNLRPSLRKRGRTNPA